MLGKRPLASSPIASLPEAVVTYRSGIIDYHFGRQEQPRHAPSFLYPGIEGPNVNPPDRQTSIILRQEQPDHPPSLLRGSIHFYKLPNTDYLFTQQEVPRGYHYPSSFFWDPNEFDDADPILGYYLGRQEQPTQFLWPPPPMISGQPTAHETVKGYILG